MRNELDRYSLNLTGRDYIVGDIHGHFNRLAEDLARIKFDPSCDRLFSVGDLVDRGPDCDQALDWLERPWFKAVRGNHEEAAIMFADGQMPAMFYLRGYGGAWNIANPQREQQRIADAFRALPLAIELETAAGLLGIVHAECPLPDWAEMAPILAEGGLRAEALIACCTEGRDRAKYLNDAPVAGVVAVVVGHNPHERMTSLGNTLYIDTYGWRPLRRGSHFTILDVATLRPALPAPAVNLDWSDVPS